MARRRTRRTFSARPLEALEARSLLCSGHLGMLVAGAHGPGPHDPVDVGPIVPDSDPEGMPCACALDDGRQQLEDAARAEIAAYIHHQHHHTPHMDDAVKQAEHEALLDLVPVEGATHVAILDGAWGDPKTWLGCEVPGPDARVWIMPGRTVTIDEVLGEPIATVRASGTLEFAPDHDTQLAVETLVVDPEGTFLMGTEHEPIAAGRTARVVILGAGPIDAAADPFQLGRGVLSHGTVSIHGAEVTPWLTLARPARRGDTTLELSAVPVGWKAGDTIALAGAALNQHERLTVASVDGRTVRLTSPLKFAHAAPTAAELAAKHGEAPDATLEIHVSNLTRNARFESAHPDEVATRGHVMFMHSPNVEVANAGFYGMGRTDKSQPISDANPRGRYALHLHRTGTAAAAVEVRGVAVDGSPGWGVVNHSSNVDVSASVAYGAVGAAFVAEAGDERGAFRDNVAIWSPGSPNDHPDNTIVRRPINDYGFNGHGYWLQSPTVAMVGNVASGSASYGIAYYPVFYEDPSNPIEKLTMAENRDNTIYAGRRGLRIANTKPEDGPHRIEGLTAWALGYDAFSASYSQNTEVVGSTFIGRGAGAAVYVDAGAGFNFRDNYIVGFSTGVVAGYGGRNEITGGYLNNTVDIRINKNIHVTNARLGVREVLIEGVELAGGGIALNGAIETAPTRDGQPNNGFWTQFTPERILWDGQQIYYDVQAANQVITSPLPGFGGKTNAQLMATFGQAYAGAVMPAGAVASPKVAGGRVGSPVDLVTGPLFWISTATKPNGMVNVGVRNEATAGALLVHQAMPASELVSGWNVVWIVDPAGVRRPAFRFIA